jgi:hypothetical protein
MREPMFQQKPKSGSLKWAILGSAALVLILVFDAYAPKFEETFSKPQKVENKNTTILAAESFNRDTFDSWFPEWKQLPSDTEIQDLWLVMDDAIHGRPLSISDKAKIKTGIGKLINHELSTEQRTQAAKDIMQVLDSMQVDSQKLNAIWDVLKKMGSHS